MNDIAAVLEACNEDPWSLSAAERDLVRRALRQAQDHWLPRIQAAVEPPIPDDDFPAFLLETERFHALGETLEHCGAALDTGARDELQRFVDLFRCWSATAAMPLRP